MTSPAGLLDFFILEGSEYVEQLDGLLARASGGAPDPVAFSQAARALRGSATMAKLAPMAELAGTVERIARGLCDGRVAWTPALRGALVAAVDDAKILIRAVRAWGPAEDARAGARCAELAQYAPSAPAAPTPQAVGSVTFLAAETESVAQAVDDFMARPSAPDALALMLQRVRALRGVAALRDLPPLGDVVGALERAVKPLELAERPVPLQPAALALVAAASALLHRAAGEIRAQGRPDGASPLAQRFAAASAALDALEQVTERIVPITSLYFADEGPHVVSRAPNPPTTPAERFRLEVVSQAEHLRRLVGEARASAGDPTGRQRLARELRGALRGIGEGADSFGEREVADFMQHVADDAAQLDGRTLDALDEVARLLADARTRQSELARRLEELSRSRHTHEMASIPEPSVANATPATGRNLKALLQTSLAGMASLERDPSSAELAERAPTVLTPTTAASIVFPTAADGIVPIQTLLYRGNAALARARELRDEIRARGGAADQAVLDELFELLDLAAAS